MLRVNIKKFLSCKIVLIICTLFILMPICLAVYTIGFGYADIGTNMDASTLISNLLVTQPYNFIIVLFFSFEYMSYSKRVYIKETMDAITNRKICEYTDLLIVFSVVFLHFICNIIPSVISSLLFSTSGFSYCMYCIKVLVVYVLLSNLIPMFIGALIAKLNKSYLSYCVLIAVGMLILVLNGRIICDDIQIGSVYELLEFFCINSKFEYNRNVFLPIDIHFISKVLVWLFIMMAIYAFCGKKIDKICSVVSILLAGFMLLLWIKPSGGYYPMYSVEEDKYIFEDVDISNVKEETKYYIEKYEMNIDVANQLHIDAFLTFSNDNLDCYSMTLYGGYKVQSITDFEGQLLEYEQNGNIVTVYNEDKLEGIHIVYEGRGAIEYYANRQGMYLPGYFEYYPVAGVKKVFNNSFNCFTYETLQYEADFDVTVDSGNKVYSNLESSDDSEDVDKKYSDHFVGKSDNLTLVSGFYGERNINGITYICPMSTSFLDMKYNRFYRRYIELSAAYLKDDEVLDGKKILVTQNDSYNGLEYMFGQDIIITNHYDVLEKEYRYYRDSGYLYNKSSDYEFDRTIFDIINNEVNE